MSHVTTIAFFNNKGGVGKTSLVYHMAWMLADLGVDVLAADLDPQANLTAAFLNWDRLEEVWNDPSPATTIHRCLQPLLAGTGDIASPHVEEIEISLSLLVGDLGLSTFEDELSAQWPRCLEGTERAFRVLSAFWRIVQQAAETAGASVALLDLGPNLGAINRSALIAADHVVLPLAPDLFSLQGLENLGPTFRGWRRQWKQRLQEWEKVIRAGGGSRDLKLPEGEMDPTGYIVLQHAVRLDRPVRAYEKWIARIPEVYHRAVLDEALPSPMTVNEDPHCLALLKHYRSLMPLAQEARKPIFHLKPADGAIGAHQRAVQEAEQDFGVLTRAIAERTGIALT